MIIRILGKRVTPETLVLWLTGMSISILWGMPLLWMVSTSLKPEGQIMRYPIEWLPRQVSLENYQIVFNYPVLRWFWNSLFVAMVTTALVVFFSAMAGYALARMRFWGRKFVFGIILSSRMIPGTVALIPLYLIIARFRLLDTYLALIMPAVASTLGVYLFRQFFFSLPRELEDAALIDGCGRFGLFFRIALPLAIPALLTVALITFVASWNDFLWPLLVTSTDTATTMPVGMMKFNRRPRHRRSAGAQSMRRDDGRSGSAVCFERRGMCTLDPEDEGHRTRTRDR